MNTIDDLSIPSLRAAYLNGSLTPRGLTNLLSAKIAAIEPSAIWIHLLSQEQLLQYAEALESQDPRELPLYGIPFAIKDNIDLAGTPTTAACPSYAYTPEKSAFVVERLIAAGAIPIGKTNLDQFATGLVGLRSPYGIPDNAYRSEYIPGGSSSGSAVACAKQLVSFALGTDTAGSGRVPASLNNLVGHKPSKGTLSCRGVVPACKSLDCVSIFANTAEDAQCIYSVAAQFDPKDPYAVPSQHVPEAAPLGSVQKNFTFGVPETAQLKFFGDIEAEQLYAKAIQGMEALGGLKVTIDFTPFLEAALLLYEGPWVAERFVAIEEFIRTSPDALHPVTHKIIAPGEHLKASDAFKAEYKLKSLKRLADQTLETVDFVLTPTNGTVYTKSEVAAKPIELNSNLGYYTNFMNLLDYAATAFPAGFYKHGLPFGVTAFAPKFHDAKLLDIAGRFATGTPPVDEDTNNIPEGWNAIVVCGAHLSGMALNGQLTSRQARLWRTTRTAKTYKFYALPAIGDSIPPRPGVIKVCPQSPEAVSIYVEVWLIPTAHFGSFVTNIPAPLGIGKVTLENGDECPGFICEPIAIHSPQQPAQDISHLADWRKFINQNTSE
ncbi:allophanate hydrolase [Rubritalea marina]|uniref:allophanate hydrolase n=1 Tax=Rubritalea marina TaxID=361055 RepID=UPI00035F6DA0|nr:allophanate hydrolase [Rubritalea marina]